MTSQRELKSSTFSTPLFHCYKDLRHLPLTNVFTIKHLYSTSYGHWPRIPEDFHCLHDGDMKLSQNSLDPTLRGYHLFFQTHIPLLPGHDDSYPDSEFCLFHWVFFTMASHTNISLKPECSVPCSFSSDTRTWGWPQPTAI